MDFRIADKECLKAVTTETVEVVPTVSEAKLDEVEPTYYVGEVEESKPEEAHTTLVEAQANASVAEVSMDVVASEEVAPVANESAVVSQEDIEKACADFKVDAVIVNSDSENKT